MSIYLVGDVQGCFSELTALLAQVNFNPTYDQLYLAGDLVARGTDSLATLRFVKSLGSSAKVVLGNHDLHLLAVYAGIKKEKKSDKLTELLAAEDIDELITWLAQQPLLQTIPCIKDDNGKIIEAAAYMTHAGLTPQWSVSEAKKQALNIESKLKSLDRNKWLSLMYGESPNSWLNAHTDIEKFRFSINALTRMRYCFSDGSLEFNQKSAPTCPRSSDLEANENNAPKQNIQPWYHLSKAINQHAWIFGHWASLMGKCNHPNIYPLDTGCVWGNHLTLLRWHDKQVFIEHAHK